MPRSIFIARNERSTRREKTASHRSSPFANMVDTHQCTTHNLTEIIDWPFTASTATAKKPEQVRVTHPKTSHQPYKGYEQEYLDRRRLIITLICFALALFSDAVSITLYVCVGIQERKVEWLFRAWIVVSAGATVMLVPLAVSFWRNYVKARRSQENDYDQETPLKAIGRKELQGDIQSIGHTPLVNKNHGGYVSESLQSPATVPHSYEAYQSPSSAVTDNTMKRFDNYTVTAGHVLSPISPPEANNKPSPSSPTITPPQGFPPPAVVSHHAAQAEQSNDDVFFETRQRDGSTDSASTTKARDAQITRNDSVKKLREAMLRRKQAREQLK